MTDRRRALLTDNERMILLGEKNVSDNHYYTVISRVRDKINLLEDDLEALQEHATLFDELQDVVCDKENNETDS